MNRLGIAGCLFCGALGSSAAFGQCSSSWSAPTSGTRVVVVNAENSLQGCICGVSQNDRLDTFSRAQPIANFAIQIATPIPGPAGVAVLGIGAIAYQRRRRA